MSASQSKVVQYFFAPHSPWTYLGHARLMAIAAKTGAQIDVRPFDLGKVFSVSGGLPLAKRAPQRQAYRLA
ncbi:MAG: 2-hydroxychromene-2-carboxylate isomerase, partial [Janthinobacterium sp.]